MDTNCHALHLPNMSIIFLPMVQPNTSMYPNIKPQCVCGCVGATFFVSEWKTTLFGPDGHLLFKLNDAKFSDFQLEPDFTKSVYR